MYSILGRLTKSIELAELEDIVLQTFLEVFQADQALLVGRDAAGRFMIVHPILPPSVAATPRPQP